MEPFNDIGNGNFSIGMWFDEIALSNFMWSLEGWVKSSVIVGHDDADWEKVATPVEAELDNEEKRPGFDRVLPCELVMEPERNVFSAADVKLAMDLAAGGSG